MAPTIIRKVHINPRVISLKMAPLLTTFLTRNFQRADVITGEGNTRVPVELPTNAKKRLRII